MVAAAFLVIATYRLRYAFYGYIALFPMLPAYIAIPIVKGGAGMSLQRILTYEMALLTGLSILLLPNVWRPVFHSILEWRNYLVAFLVLCVTKFVSTLFSGNAIGLVYWVDELLLVSISLLLGVRYISTIAELRKVVAVLLSVLTFCVLLSFIEYFMGHNLLANVVSIEVATAGENVLEGKERDGAYRNMVLFDNPLSNAEYLVLSASVLLAAFSLRIMKYWVLGIIPFYFLAIVFTGSRSPWLVMVMSMSISAYLLLISRQSAPVRFGSKLALMVSGALFILFIYWAINNPTTLLSSVSFMTQQSVSDNISTLSRLFQYALIPPKIFGNEYSGFLGAGMKSDFLENVGVPLDNYYLRVLIEGGVVGLLAFIYMQYVSIMKVTLKTTFSEITPVFRRRIRFSILSFFVSFAAYKIFLSMTYNNPYYYLMVGGLIALTQRNQSTR